MDLLIFYVFATISNASINYSLYINIYGRYIYIYLSVYDGIYLRWIIRRRITAKIFPNIIFKYTIQFTTMKNMIYNI